MNIMPHENEARGCPPLKNHPLRVFERFVFFTLKRPVYGTLISKQPVEQTANFSVKGKGRGGRASQNRPTRVTHHV